MIWQKLFYDLESKYEEFCQLDIQCQSKDKNSRCNKDFNMCECQVFIQ